MGMVEGTGQSGVVKEGASNYCEMVEVRTRGKGRGLQYGESRRERLRGVMETWRLIRTV